MRILFVMGQAGLGGIETYCLRMCRELRERGHDLDVWFVKSKTTPALVDAFREVATVRFLSRWTPVPLLPFAPQVPAGCDLVFTTGRLSLMFGALALQSGPCPPLVAGVFSQWEYSGVVDDYKSRISHEILDQIGWRNLVFCTEGCRTFHLEALGDAVNAALVSPLLVKLPAPTDDASRMSGRPRGAPLRIVSVGNFTPFKTYHFTVPAVVADLRAAGHAVEWTIFGEGIERVRIEQAIDAAGVRDVVHLAGRLDYARFADEVGRADLYIGAGTTLIEASALGVPSLVALDDNPDATTPGFFADREGTFTSDHADGEVLTPFAAVIAAYATMSDADRDALRDRSRRRAQAYSIDGAEREIRGIIAHTRAVRPRFGTGMRARYVAGVVREVVRVAMGRGPYNVR